MNVGDCFFGAFLGSIFGNIEEFLLCIGLSLWICSVLPIFWCASVFFGSFFLFCSTTFSFCSTVGVRCWGGFTVFCCFCPPSPYWIGCDSCTTCTVCGFSSTTFYFSHAMGAWSCLSSKLVGLVQIFLFFLPSCFTLLLVAVVLVKLVFPSDVLSLAVDRFSECFDWASLAASSAAIHGTLYKWTRCVIKLMCNV